MDLYEQTAKNRNEQMKKLHRAQKIRQITIFCVIGAVFLGIIIGLIVRIVSHKHKADREESVIVTDVKYNNVEPELDVQLLDINEYSRPGLAIDEKITGIVVHYTANPDSTAQQNRDYFQNLSTTKATYASSHFIIGLDGEIIQCVPCNEIAYASNDRNHDTISIECCYSDESGKFNGNTYESLVRLVTWLMGRYDLSVDDVIRHYDVTGKNCPKYFVENEEAWSQFKLDLLSYIDANGVKKDSGK